MKPEMPTIAATAVAMVSGLAYASPPELPVPSALPQAREEISQMIVRPKHQMELAKNIKFILDQDLELDDAFYTEANLKDFFNLDSVLIDDDDIGNGNRKISVVSSKFSVIFPQPQIRGSANFAPGAHLVAGRTLYKTGVVTAAINFGMDEGGPSFYETWRIFGDKFIKLDPQPHGTFGGPLPTRVPHGNE
jgi:hypothetical protein